MCKDKQYFSTTAIFYCKFPKQGRITTETSRQQPPCEREKTAQQPGSHQSETHEAHPQGKTQKPKFKIELQILNV